jgi:cytochrome c553
MKRILTLLVALLVAFAVAGLWAAPAPADAAAGKAVYAKKCAMCHGPDGVAKDSMAKMLKVEMKALGSKEVQVLKDEEIKKITVEGKGKMKGVAGMSDADVANLIAFVRTLKK